MRPEDRKEGDRARAGATRGLTRSGTERVVPTPPATGSRSGPNRATRVRLDVRVSESERPPSADGALGRSDLPAEPTHAPRLSREES